MFSLAVIPLLGCGCVYYNTYFNARHAYEEAEKTRRKDPERALSSNERRLYDRTINKCARVILDYPSSEWRDDAVLLMGKAFYRKGDYDKAQIKFMELRTLYDRSDLLDEATYFESLTLMAVGEYTRSRRLLGELERSGWPEPMLPLLAADCFYNTGELDSALVRYRKIAESPEIPEIRSRAILSCTETLISAGRMEEALEFIRSEPAPPGSGSEIRFRLEFAEAECLHALGAVEKALSVFREIGDREEFFDFNDETLLRMASIEADSVLILEGIEESGLAGKPAADYRLARLERATSLYNDVANRYPRTDSACEAYFRLGMLHRDCIGDLNSAKDAFRSSSREKPGSETGKAAILESASLIKLNSLLEKLDRAEDAETRAGLHMEMAEVFLLNIRKPAEAKKHYETVREETPGSPLAAKATLATAWIERYRFDNRACADSLYAVVAADFPDSEEAAKARLELRLPASGDGYRYGGGDGGGDDSRDGNEDGK